MSSAAPQLDATFAALSHPIRREIVARLALGEATVGELAEPFGVSLPAVSRHLRVLAEAGLVERGHAGRERPSRLAVEPLRDAGDWIERHRNLWEGRLDRLEAHLSEQRKGAPDD